MRRRDFLASVALGPLLAAKRQRNPQATLVRAAVVIGVNKTGNLPVLNAAVSGANKVGNWLHGEGFAVAPFVTHPVTVAPIKAKIKDLVNRGTLDQLVIYFSGHGFLKNGSEMWLLSEAPGDADEAISLLESIELARDSGVPSVVIISDACRSTPDSLRAQRVRGVVLFPNGTPGLTPRPDVDRFLATLPGDAAVEATADVSSKTFEGLYTAAFLDAFTNPTSDMVRKVGGVDVVPNRSLKRYLVNEVSRRAAAKAIRLRQYPDSILECDDSTYIGRVVPPQVSTASPQSHATLGDLTSREFGLAGLQVFSGQTGGFSDQALNQLSLETGFGAAHRAIVDATAPPSFETQTGFAVHGTRVVGVLTSRGVSADLLTQGDGAGQPAIIRIIPQGRPAATVTFRFADGSGTVVAALAGYIGALSVARGGVMSLTYAPSRNSSRWDPSAEQQVNPLRAAVATAARFGTFRIEGNGADRAGRAAALADRIRVSKAIDPSLGIYAAYAYAEAGIGAQITSVHDIMRGDLGVDLFDVALLARQLEGNPLSRQTPPVPFCPMLSQGWAWLRVRRVVLPPELDAARDHLRPALWTTFDGEGMQMVETMLKQIG